MNLSDFAPEVKAVFPYIPEEVDPCEMIFDLSGIVDADKVEFFGEILVKLPLQSSRDPRAFVSNLDHLQDRLELGLQYSRNRRSLCDISKIVGRDIFHLVNSLTSEQ